MQVGNWSFGFGWDRSKTGGWERNGERLPFFSILPPAVAPYGVVVTFGSYTFMFLIFRSNNER